MTDRQAWQQRDGETAKAFAAFEHYRLQEASKRTIVEAARRTYGERGVSKNGRPVGRIRAWCDENEWESRARAWDEHLAALRDIEWEAEAVEATRRHAREASLFETVLLAPARALAAKLVNDPNAVNLYDGLTAGELTRLADRTARGHAIVSRFERLSRGLAEDRVEITGKDGGPIVMTTEEAKDTLAPILGVDRDAVVDELAQRRRAARAAKRTGEEETGS